jgi:hypothetical protein
MKKSIFNNAVLIAVFSAMLMISCNKETINENSSTGSNNNGSSLVAGDDPEGNGSISGTILPPDAKATIYLNGNVTLKLFLSEKGEILPNSVPAGDYDVRIVPANTNYSVYIINDIRVTAGAVTNLGTITLQ